MSNVLREAEQALTSCTEQLGDVALSTASYLKETDAFVTQEQSCGAVSDRVVQIEQHIYQIEQLKEEVGAYRNAYGKLDGHITSELNKLQLN